MSAMNLAILISLRDAASAGVSRVSDRLRAMGKEGKSALQSWENLRKDMAKGLVIGGVGIAGLALLNRGAKDAGNFEASLHGLKSAFQELGSDGQINMGQLNSQMDRASKLAISLGNDLQGSTEDYLQIFTQLKKAGVDVETILTGAGKAAGYLANVSGTITTGQHVEQAKQLGQYGKLFALKPDEFEQSVNLFSALKDRFDIDSSDLIESSKYFNATASSLGLKGMAGAEETATVFALLKRYASLEGSTAGTGLTSFFSMYLSHKKDIEKLHKEKGIDLEFFNKKTGDFLGFENIFVQMEKLRVLSEEERSRTQNKLFGEEGGKVAGAFVEAGGKALREANEERKKAVLTSDKINAQMELYNSKVEAVSGSWDNLKAQAFTPLLGPLKTGLDTTNKILGATQAWLAENPKLATMTVYLFAAGSALTAVYGGLKSGLIAWKMWKVASEGTSVLEFFKKVSEKATTGGKNVADFFSRMTRAADGAGESITRADRRLGLFKRQLTGIPAMIGTTVVLSLATGVVAYILQLKAEAEAAWAEAAGVAESERQANERLLGVKPPPGISQGEWVDQINKQQRSGMSSLIKEFAENRLTSFSGSSAVDLWQKYVLGKGDIADPEGVQMQMRQHLPQLKTPSLFAQFMRSLASNKELMPEARQSLRNAAIAEFPKEFEAYSRALQQAKGDETEAIRLLIQADIEAAQKKADAATNDVAALESHTGALERATARINQAQPGGAQEGGDGTTKKKPVAKVASRAMGGVVERDGVAVIHAGEHIVPAAQVSRGYRANRSEGRRDRERPPSVKVYISVPPGSGAANNPKLLARLVADEVRKQRERR